MGIARYERGLSGKMVKEWKQCLVVLVYLKYSFKDTLYFKSYVKIIHLKFNTFSYKLY